jgi:uncharacterized OsmC-like protein
MQRIEVRYEEADRFSIQIRDHELKVDQPDTGDAAPTPTELFVAGLVSCVGFYAGRFCQRHGIDPAGLSVTCDWSFASDKPARVDRIDVRVGLPEGFPPDKLDRLQAVIEHCTVHNSIVQAPEVSIVAEAPAAAA